MNHEQIRYVIEDGVVTITLHRPERRNAWTPRMGEELLDAFSRADADDGVRVVIVTGEGKNFCAGADLEGGGATFDARTTGRIPSTGPYREPGGRVALRIYEMRKPVIAAINGPAVGIGITMTLPMDFRLAAESAKIGFVFARRGITPEACSTWFLPRLVGMGRATEWLMTGRVFGAPEARESGLLNRVVPDESLMESARELAREIARHTSAVSLALIRRMLWRSPGLGHPALAHNVESQAILYMGSSADAREGIESFLEKRPAVFKLSPSKDYPDTEGWWPAKDP